MCLNLSGYKLTSKRRGGQWSGPCAFSHEGRDRFTIEPYPPEGGDPRWFCRACSVTCRFGQQKDNVRFGTLTEFKAPKTRPRMTQRNDKITVDMAQRYAKLLGPTSLAYLQSRGISPDTARYFGLGQMSKKFITIPNFFTWKGKLHCRAIKKRWIEQFRPPNTSAYQSFSGSVTKGIFNFDTLDDKQTWGIIANSLFDVMLLHGLGLPVIGPFAGEASWDERWIDLIPWKHIINLGDWDPLLCPHKSTGAESYRPGTRFMLSRALKLQGHNVQKVTNSYPPDGWSDVSQAWAEGVDIESWLTKL